MAPKVGITWDAEADRKILLSILKDSTAAANINWEALAAELSTDTATCSVAALKKHLSRLRVAARDDQDNGEGSDSPAPKTSATKGKSKANGTTGSSAAPKPKGKGKPRPKRKASEDSDDDDEGTPLTKKLQKVAPGLEELQVKTGGSDYGA